MDLVGSQEFGVVVFDRKAEVRTVVVPHDLHVVAVELSGRVLHPRRPIIVSGDRERPATQRLIVRLQKLRRGFRRTRRVEAIVAVTRDLQELAASGTGELPDAESAGAGAHPGGESRL